MCREMDAPIDALQIGADIVKRGHGMVLDGARPTEISMPT